MPTRLTLTAAGSDAGASHTLSVEEGFDQVCEAMMPINPPNSAIESRAKCTFTKIEGGQILIHPQLIGWVEEVNDDVG